MAGSLGCGEHRVMVAERGAALPFDELEWSTLTWGRVLDDISAATVTVETDPACAALLGSLREWRHELWIFRDDEAVWRGPLTPQPSYTETSTTVAAKDYFAWFERRSIDNAIIVTGTDLTYLFYFVLRAGTSRDPHPGLTVLPALSGITDDLNIDPAQHPKVADELRTLARLGVDFTVILNDLLLGSPEFVGAPLTYLSSDVVSGVTVTAIPTASEVTVIGANSGDAGKPLVATVGGVDPLIGLVTEEDNESGAKTAEAVRLAAQSRYDFFAGEPCAATMTLDAAAPVTMAQLVPGTKVTLDIDSTARPLSGQYRLTKVDVSVAVSDQGETEAVTIEVGPLGSVSQ